MSYKETIEVIQYTCLRCGHKWQPRVTGKEPKVCPNPKCHSAYWNEERKRARKDE